MVEPSPRVCRELSLHVRCTKAERDYWKAKASAARIPFSQYLRDILHDAPMAKRRSPPPVDAKLLQQIAAAGNNLNQIAKGVNQSSRLFLSLDLISLQAELLIIERQLEVVLQAHVR